MSTQEPTEEMRKRARKWLASIQRQRLDAGWGGRWSESLASLLASIAEQSRAEGRALLKETAEALAFLAPEDCHEDCNTQALLEDDEGFDDDDCDCGMVQAQQVLAKLRAAGVLED